MPGISGGIFDGDAKTARIAELEAQMANPAKHQKKEPVLLFQLKIVAKSDLNTFRTTNGGLPYVQNCK